MLIRFGFDIVFGVAAPAPMVVMLATHADFDGALRVPGRLRLEPEVPVEEFLDSFGNRCARLVAPPGQFRLWDDGIVEVDGLPDRAAPDAVQHKVEDLPAEVLPYLLGSRYCEVDRLSDVAWSLFGQTPEGWGRAQAICDWVHSHVQFGYPFARPTKSAYDVYEERKGVCRDFTHLALTFCRCMNIPARYTTGYLGDIGVPLSPDPMDFSGWFEVFLGGKWHTMDARHNRPRIGRIVVARGRDAVDVALTTTFGKTTLDRFIVWTDEVGPEALTWTPAPK
jgi:transglutaminase-like putative cysteine protease